MRRADRLFQIVQLLRQRRLATAAWLAGKLEVSERTIYRDVRDLVSSGVPIEGEAGVGYALPRGFDLPPLMFTKEELSAVVLGARIVKAWADSKLSSAAASALSRIEAVITPDLRESMDRTALFAPDFHVKDELRKSVSVIRAAIDEKRRLRIEYEDREGEKSDRIVRPLGLFFWGYGWTLGAYCEMRLGFRNFRLDRIASATVLDRFEDEVGKTIDDLLRSYRDS